MPANDDKARRPYKRYHARRLNLPRRSPADGDLPGDSAAGDAGSRQNADRRDDGRGSRTIRPRHQYSSNGRAAAGDRPSDPGAGSREEWHDGARARGRAAEVSGGAGAARTSARRRPRVLWRRIALGIGVLVVLVLVGVGIWAFLGWRTFDSAVAKANARIDEKTRAALTPDSGSIFSTPTTILVLGVDKRANDPGRSDTIMLVRSNPETKSFSQLSIARDMRVSIPGHGMGKINTGYFWGGPSLAIKTIRGFTGIPINHIVIVSFNGFPRFIDAIGGVDVYVPKTIKSWYSGGRTVTFTKGWHHMDGTTALIYSRIRYVDDDFHRQARQQQVVTAMQKKLSSASSLPSLPWTGAKLMKTISTDLTSWQLVQLAWRKWRSSPQNTHHYILAGTPAMIGGQSYIISERTGNLAKINRFLKD